MGGAGDLGDRLYRRQRLVAAIALLQPGIDPIFLMLLTHHSGLALADHGLVVAGSMAGMAAGALLFAGLKLSATTLRLAALGALVASLATVAVTGLASIVAARALFGLCNGMLYAAALAGATRRDPAHAIGTVLLGQLLLATAVALALPQLATMTSPGLALAALAGFGAITMVLVSGDGAVAAPAADPEVIKGDGRAAAAAVFLFVCASMMVWSYVGAEGSVAGLSETTIGIGVALGSLAGGAAALVVAHAARRGWPAVPVMVGGGVAALAMLSPLASPATGAGFAAVMIVFNLGATYAVAQFSAHAIMRSGSNRRLVPALQSGGMVAGPLGAAAAVHGGGFGTLALAVAAVLVAAVGALAIDQRLRVGAAAQQKHRETGDEALTQT